ncbi:hypothetical protein DAPPUDRAFT_247592 [Daphnia pulex]|uniref:Cuticle protein 6 n=1 Tax=Daphnia pulex TaxID=6669 RepID=E9GSS4_DAPPU|nr:hypothetical protein DAPPUDRAFT_247592 [Daphnia pulex]|eukprot:EFX77529.1 hypothetical protein DAPPUDRAFT_247592 [Daphnia pulex]
MSHGLHSKWVCYYGYGNQIGSYAYINPEGKEVRVSYTAVFRGFRVQSNNLPVAPAQIEDTPETAAAKADHAAAITAAKSGVTPVAPVVPAVVLPAPVQGTPEVADAKAEFAVKFAATKAGRAKRQVFGYGAAPFLTPTMPFPPFPLTPIRLPLQPSTLSQLCPSVRPL